MHAHIYTCKAQEGEKKVLNDLALSAEQIKEYAKRGESLSIEQVTQNAGVNAHNPTWDVDLNNIRGTDIADLYMLQQETRRQMYAQHKDNERSAKMALEMQQSQTQVKEE